MAYSDFKLHTLKERFGIRMIENQRLFPNPSSVKVSPTLHDLLQRYIPLAISISTEKARSEFIIAPILAEVTFRFHESLSLFSGIEFNVEPEHGLNGRCDYILSRSAEQLELSAPAVMMVEAKNENIPGGIPQCIAEMIAAQRFNARHHQEISPIYGVVTTGSLWRFLKLIEATAYIDVMEYSLQTLEQILGIFSDIVKPGS